MHQILQKPNAAAKQTSSSFAKPRNVGGNTNRQSRAHSPHSAATYDYAFSRIPVHSAAPIRIQPKLTIGAAGDAFEQEADRIADQVMRMPEPRARFEDPTSNPEHSTAPAARVQTKSMNASDGGGIEAPPIVHEVLNSPGQPLDAATREFFEPRFGHDFSHVRVHTDATASKASASIQARAFTAGRDIAFAAGEYAPSVGRQMLAHELAHVAQQQPAVRRQLADDPKARGKPKPPAKGTAASKYAYQWQPATTAAAGTWEAVSTYGFTPGPIRPPADPLIPIADFISYVEVVEKQYPNDSPNEIVTRIRVHSYGDIKFKLAIPAAHYFGIEGVRDLSSMQSSFEILPVYERLTARADENPTKEKPHGDNPSPYIVLADGSRIDVGHLLLGLDALANTLTGPPYNYYGILNTDLASWVADLAFASYWTEYHARENEPADDSPIKPKTPDFEAYYHAAAPVADLLGDADALSANQERIGGQTLSLLLRSYYLGTNGRAPGVQRRWRTFCEASGLSPTISGESVTWDPAMKKPLVDRIDRLVDLLMAGVAAGAVATATGITARRRSWPSTPRALDKFLGWLKSCLEAEIAANRK